MEEIKKKDHEKDMIDEIEETPESETRAEEDEEVTEDDVPEIEEKKHHSKHAKKNVARQKQSVGIWQFLTVMFAGLFVLSLFTGSFDFIRPSGDIEVTGNIIEKVSLENDNKVDAIEATLTQMKGTIEENQLFEIESDLDELKFLVDNQALNLKDNQQEIESLYTELRAKLISLGGNTQQTGNDPIKQPTGSPVTLDFYVMSRCPYGVQVEDAIYPVLQEIGDYVDFNLYFIANENPDGTFSSLQGEPEVLGNIIQLCAIKYEPAYMDLIYCMNEDYHSIPENWEACAADLGMDVAKLRTCYTQEEGKDLLRESIAQTQAMGATGSPTIYLDGQRYQGGRSPMDFMRVLCDALDNEPPACKDLPAPTEVQVITLNDERCGIDCDMSSLIAQLDSIFPGMKLTELDYGTEEGKMIYAENGLAALPAVLFDESVEDAEGYANVAPYLVPAGKYSSLRIGATFDPELEICDNEIDDTGNGLIDCEDPDCASTLICNPDFFVECTEEFGVAGDTVIFYYSNTCPWCELMKPGITQLEEEGYIFLSIEAGNPEEEDIINACFRNHMGTAVPQFICPNTAEIRPGAFATAEAKLDVDAMREWADKCIEG